MFLSTCKFFYNPNSRLAFIIVQIINLIFKLDLTTDIGSDRFTAGVTRDEAVGRKTTTQGKRRHC